jgi:hypothetical protein
MVAAFFKTLLCFGRYNRLMLIKSFANVATTEFMKAREVRYLCKVGREDLVEFGTLLITAKKSGLVMGKVVTASSKFYSSILSADPGDVVVELVGILASNKDAFLKAINIPSLSSVMAVMATAQEIDVSIISVQSGTAMIDYPLSVAGCLQKLRKGQFQESELHPLSHQATHYEISDPGRAHERHHQ